MQLASRTLPPHAAPLAQAERIAPQPAASERVEPWRTQFEHEPLGDFLWRLTLECLDDVAAARHMRAPKADETWRDAATAEARLLAQLDAALCFGPDLETRLRAGIPELASPDDFFAGAVAAGCIASASSRSLLEELFRAAIEHDDEVVSAVVEALCLGSHPATCDLARALLGDPEPRLRAGAMQVLGFRGEAHADEIAPLLRDPAPEVQTSAGHALRHPGIAAHEIAELQSLLDHADPRVVAAALEAGLCKRLGAAHARAVALCERGEFGFADAALSVAISGDEHDTARMLSWLAQSADPHLLRAAGYFGLADSVPLLVERLSAEQDEVRAAAAEALARITAAPLRETTQIALYEAEDKPFVDNPDATIEVERVAQSPAAWARFWEQHCADYLRGHRYRGGAVFDAHAVFETLDRGSALYAQRRIADLELRILAGNRAPQLEIRDWCARQATGMTQWQACVNSRALATVRGFIRARA